MAGQSGNPGGSGQHDRSRPAPSVAFSAPVRSVAVRGRFRLGRWTARTRNPALTDT